MIIYNYYYFRVPCLEQLPRAVIEFEKLVEDGLIDGWIGGIHNMVLIQYIGFNIYP